MGLESLNSNEGIWWEVGSEHMVIKELKGVVYLTMACISVSKNLICRCMHVDKILPDGIGYVFNKNINMRHPSNEISSPIHYIFLQFISNSWNQTN